MPPKRKTSGGGGRGKRPRQLSPDAPNSEEPLQTPQQTGDGDALPAPQMAEEGSSKLLKTLPIEGDADADGEADDDRMDATHDTDAEGEKEDFGKPTVEHQQQQGTSDEPGSEGDEDHHEDHEMDEVDVAEPMPPTSTRGRGRGRGRRARGTGRTRSSPRKVPQQTQAQLTSKPSDSRGRKAARGRGRGMVASNPPRTAPLTTEEVNAGAGEGGGDETDGKEEREGDEEVEGEEPTAKAVSHQPLPHPPPQEQSHQVQQVEHSLQQPTHQIHSAGPSTHTPPSPFPPHHPAYYPTYPPQTAPFQFAYGAPPPPSAGSSVPDGRPYLALRPDEAQPMYTTSFTTTVGTGNESNSASSSFHTPYPSSAPPAHALDANAPQGNPFPPSAPMPVPPYGPNVYRVDMSDDEDDDQDQEQTVGANAHVPPPKKKGQSSVGKGGGRTGRGDHVACHFCRGRKLKCDGRRPTCGHCALRTQACAYDPSVRRRGPGRKEKNNRRDRNATSSKRTGGVASDFNIGPQTSTQSHSQMTTPSTEGVKRKRRQVHHATSQSQTSVLRFEDAEGTSMHGPVMKPSTAAYGVENNERLGFYYTGEGPGQFAPPYPPYGGYDHHAASTHPQQAAYAYAQDGGEDDADGNADMDAEGEGDGEHEGYGTRPEGGSYGQPSNGNYSHAWPAESPGGVSVSHAHHM